LLAFGINIRFSSPFSKDVRSVKEVQNLELDLIDPPFVSCFVLKYFLITLSIVKADGLLPPRDGVDVVGVLLTVPIVGGILQLM
jgi:hypothetical protein